MIKDREQSPEALLLDLQVGLLAEQSAYDTVYRQEELSATQKGEALAELQAAQHNLLQVLLAVGIKEDLETLLLAEKFILKNEKEFYSDTPVMTSSLEQALKEIEAAVILVEKVRNPTSYKTVTDDYYRLDRVRIKGLPKDLARIFFMSHHSRLTNLEKARVGKMDKQLIGARKKNLNQARTNYISLQELALTA